MTDIQNIRIPNLPIGPLVDDKGMPTSEELAFRQALITSLQQNFGNEGLIAPSQNAANATTIQNNQVINQATGVAEKTLVPGTLLYDTTTNTLLVSILVAGVPTFKTVVVI